MGTHLMRDILEKLRREAESTIRALYALQQFKRLLSRRDAIDRINQNVYFWILFESSLLTKIFIGIRRLFETQGDTFNFQHAFNLIRRHITDFDAAALEDRKMQGHSERPGWLSEYMRDVYTPTERDFNALAKLVRKNSKRMSGVYTDAASKVFAHAVHTDTAMINSFLADLDLAEIETSLKAIWHFYEQVWQMYENGREPSAEISEYPYREELEDSVTRQVGVEA